MVTGVTRVSGSNIKVIQSRIPEMNIKTRKLETLMYC